MQYECSEFVPVFKALADETRLKILRMLSVDEELCACKILERIQLSQPTLSYHMKILMGCGLVCGRKDASWMRYTINDARYEEVRAFLDCLVPLVDKTA